MIYIFCSASSTFYTNNMRLFKAYDGYHLKSNNFGIGSGQITEKVPNCYRVSFYTGFLTIQMHQKGAPQPLLADRQLDHLVSLECSGLQESLSLVVMLLFWVSQKFP